MRLSGGWPGAGLNNQHVGDMNKIKGGILKIISSKLQNKSNEG